MNCLMIARTVGERATSVLSMSTTNTLREWKLPSVTSNARQVIKDKLESTSFTAL